MYTVKQFEIAKPANVVYSNFRLKDHNVLYALGYTFKAGKVGKNSIFWNDKGEAFSRDMTMKFQSIKLKSLNKETKSLKLYRIGGFLYMRDAKFDLIFKYWLKE